MKNNPYIPVQDEIEKLREQFFKNIEKSRKKYLKEIEGSFTCFQDGVVELFKKIQPSKHGLEDRIRIQQEEMKHSSLKDLEVHFKKKRKLK